MNAFALYRDTNGAIVRVDHGSASMAVTLASLEAGAAEHGEILGIVLPADLRADIMPTRQRHLQVAGRGR